jgi:predicted phage terminase large subunit-like protein
MSFWDLINTVSEDRVTKHLSERGYPSTKFKELSPIEQTLLDIRARTILAYEDKKSLTDNEQAYYNFLTNPNLSDEYYMLGLCPSSQKQFDFTASQADITVFGGAAGSGKSHCGVADLLQHIHHASFTGVIFRRTTPQLKGAGGMVEKGIELYTEVCTNFLKSKLKTQMQELKLTFPSSSTIQYRHMEHEKDRYNIQGWEISEALVDEATQFELVQIMYIISRLRNPKCPVKSHLKMTCNPDADSFLRGWLERAEFLDKEGYPLYDRSGDIVYCGEVEGDMQFRQSREEWDTEFPAIDPMTFTFIPATCQDNPVLMRLEPQYLTKLQNLPRVERARLLDGNWFVREQAAGFFKREWCGKPMSLYELPRAIRTVRSWDKAATLPSEVYPDPDYTVGLKGMRDADGHIYILDMTRGRWRPSGVQEALEKDALNDGSDTVVTIPVDAGAAGKAEADNCASKIFSLGITVKKKQTNANKVKRFEPVAALAENEMIHVVKGDWNEKFFDELEQFTGSQKGHDDIVDALSDLVNELVMKKDIGSFELPSLGGLSQTNHFRQ